MPGLRNIGDPLPRVRARVVPIRDFGRLPSRIDAAGDVDLSAIEHAVVLLETLRDWRRLAPRTRVRDHERAECGNSSETHIEPDENEPTESTFTPRGCCRVLP